jgi:ATP-dependent helicase/nuclease subunit B
VLVGSIERSRHPDLKAVFLIGTTQKQFPIPLVEDPILGDQDRAVAARQRFVLSDRPATHAAARQYLAYIAFTRPGEQLYISYPRMDSGGSEVYPSRFVQMLSERLGLKAAISGTDNEWASISGPIDLQDRLSRWASSDDQIHRRFGLGLVRRLAENPLPDLACLASPILAGLDYQNTVNFNPALIGRRWARTLPVSASRLESFGRCPYQFFSRYLLELKKREILRLEPLDLGKLYHRVLERLFHDLRKDKLDIASASEETLQSRTMALYDDQIQSDPAIANLIRHSRQDGWRIQSGREVLCEAVLNMARICRAGQFRPIAAEAGFGPGEKQARIELKTEDGTPILLCGSIDRIDAARVGEKNVAVVFDYKTRQRPINWSHLAGQIDLQLPVYLIAAGRMPGIDEVSGAFYLPIELPAQKYALDSDDGSSVEGDDKPDKKAQAKAKGIFNGEFFVQLDKSASGTSGYYNFFVSRGDGAYGRYGTSAAFRPDEFTALLRFADTTLRGMAQSILSGRIEVRPFRLGEETPCSHCDYRAVCKFDWQINDYRKVDAVNKTGFLAGLTGGGHG